MILPARTVRFSLPTTRFLGFGAVGLGVFAGGAALLYGLVQWAHLDPHLAYFIQAVVSIETSFVLNKSINWRERKGGLGRQLLSFHITKAITLPLNQVLFASLIAAGLHYMVAMVFCTGVVTVINFVANDKLVFVEREPVEGRSGAAVTSIAAADPSSLPQVAIIIPVRNSDRTIARCLRSALAQSYPDFRIYVVGNQRNRDSTWTALAEQRQDPRITCLEWQQPQNWHGRDGNAKRSLGAETAMAGGAKILAFLDSQVEAPSDWLLSGVTQLENEDVDAIAGVSVRHPDDRSLAALYQDVSLFSEWPRFGDGTLLDGASLKKAAQLPITANMMLRATALRRLTEGWPLVCPYGWEDFHLDWALLRSGVRFLCTRHSAVHRLHRSKFRMAKHVTAGMAAADFFRKFPDCGFARWRMLQATGVTAAAVGVGGLIAIGLVTHSTSLLLTVISTVALSLLLLGVRTAETARNWRAVFFPLLDVVHIGLWIVGLVIVACSTRRVEARVSHLLLARR